MSPRKLSDLDREEIVALYRTTEETTSTLANRYGVSSSTVSRFLKSQLSDSEYESLIQQKRLARTPGDYSRNAVQVSLDFEKPVIQEEWETSSEEQLELPANDEIYVESPLKHSETVSSYSEKEELKSEKETFLEEYLEEDGDDLDDEEEDYDEEEDWENDIEPTISPALSKNINVKVLPLSEANIPKTCYLVIDRSAELITRPLREFAHLGKIPIEEVQQKTLPVFDNQRIARRFSNRSQRVIKVPDGRILKKTSSYLKAKGITRLLINGQVYSLSPL